MNVPHTHTLLKDASAIWMYTVKLQDTGCWEDDCLKKEIPTVAFGSASNLVCSADEKNFWLKPNEVEALIVDETVDQGRFPHLAAKNTSTLS